MATEHIELEIELDSTYWNNPPTCKIWLNDTVIMQKNEIKELTTIKWSGDLPTGDHEVKIVLSGKNARLETVIENDVVIKDQILTIKSIKLDQIDLGHVIYLHGKYVTDDGSEHKGMVDLGWNGTFSLKFSTPIYLWLLENL